jgi:predicted regulator of Ras-like GTPase activity (Roadblock/LC7/MglB family)
MAASSQELALRYLLELSSDIRMALLLDPDGGLIAATPHPEPDRIGALARELSAEAAAAFGGGGDPVEIDAVCEGGMLFLIRSGEGAMLSITHRSVLPALIFYDMHAILTDLERAANAEARRVAAAER